VASPAARALLALVPSAQASITTLPWVPDYVRGRTRQLGLRRNTYLAILLQNYLHGPPMGLPVVEQPRRQKRRKLQVGMPAALRSAGTRAAAKWKLSFSALLTSLVVHDATLGAEELVIHPVRGVAKPEPPAAD
jgi:hypothetical protein